MEEDFSVEGMEQYGMNFSDDFDDIREKVKAANDTLNEGLETINQFEILISDVQKTLEENDIQKLYNNALDTLNDAFNKSKYIYIIKNINFLLNKFIYI